jgi:(2Fe-2S) ferredoxin
LRHWLCWQRWNIGMAKPESAPYARHIFLCTGEFCDPDGRACELYEQLREMLGDLGRYTNPCRVKRGTTPCLGVCAGGPIAVVYPEGIWYHHLDAALLARIVHEHLERGEPVEDAIFHRLGVKPDERSP